MSNTRKQSGIQIGDREGDFDGTYPGSKLPIQESDADALVSPEVKSRHPRTTNNQWRNYYNPLEPTANTGEERPDVARIAENYGRVALNRFVQPPIEKSDRPVLRNQDGRAVLGSAAMTDAEVDAYLDSHPGATFI